MNSIGSAIDGLRINLHVEEVLEAHHLIYTWVDSKDEVTKFACKCDNKNPLPRKGFNEHIKQSLLVSF